LPAPLKSGVDPQTPASGRAAGVGRQIAIATELPFVLVATVVVGGLIGFGIDKLLHTSPWGVLVFGALGFAAGVRDVLRRIGGGKRPSGQPGGHPGE